MKRRGFLTKSATGILGISAVRCSDDDSNPLAPSTNESGIPTGKIGTTDVTVSKFAFGSHVLKENVNDTAEREYMIRDAYERGVTTFDIYNAEGGAYQYEPMSRYLAPILYDVQLSMAVLPESGRTYEQEFDHMLELFNRDYFDMVRLRARSKDQSTEWSFWERLFELRDEGKVRAVGTAVHTTDDLDTILEYYGDELDYVFFPYNFYHNKAWQGHYSSEDYIPFVQTLRDRGIGVVTIKPFAGDYWIPSLKTAAKELNPDVSLTHACLRYVINSGLKLDTTFAGMNHFREFDENIKAYINPEMTEEETTVLDDIRGVMEKTAHLVLPDHYKFLNDWAPKPVNGEKTKIV